MTIIGLLGLSGLLFQNCSDVVFEEIKRAGSLEDEGEGGALQSPAGQLILNNGKPFTNRLVVGAEVRAQNAQQVLLTYNERCQSEAGWLDLQRPEASSDSSLVVFTTDVELKPRDGAQQVYMKLRSASGRESECLSEGLILDRSPPKLSWLQKPNRFSPSKDAAFRVEVVDEISGVKSLHCRLGSEEFADCKEEIFLSGLGESSHTLQVYAVDRAGNRSETLEHSWLNDFTAPIVRIRSPQPDQIIRLNSVQAEFEASDIGGSGIEELRCYLNGTELEVCASPVNLMNLAVGNYVLRVEATDRAGWEGVAETRFSVADLIPGDFMIIGVGATLDQANSYATDLMVDRLYWSRSDNAQAYQIRIIDPSNSSIACSSDGVVQTSAALQNCDLQHGRVYQALVTAFNGVEYRRAAAYEFLADLYPPQIQIGSVVQSEDHKSASLTFEVTPSGSDLKEVTCRKSFMNNLLEQDCLGLNSIAYENLPEGEHVFELEAKDKAGHTARESVSFRVRHVVCNPFNLVERDCRRGLRAHLYYANKEDRDRGNTFLRNKFSSVAVMISEGVQSNSLLYLSNLDIPTVRFDQGFKTADGGLLRNDSGEVLDEWFGLDIETVLRLAPGQEPGLYQLIAVSDDGSMVYLGAKDDAQKRPLINNDGTTSTRVGCASQGDLLEMNESTRIPLHIQWYQGPRTQLGIRLMWKPVTAESGEARSHCGSTAGLPGSSSGGWGFANDAQGSGYQRLLDQGFIPLIDDNYILDEEITGN